MSVFRLSDDVVLRDTGFVRYAFKKSANDFWELNETAYDVASFLKEPLTIKELTEKVSDLYEITDQKEEVKREIVEILHFFEKCSIIKTTNKI